MGITLFSFDSGAIRGGEVTALSVLVLSDSDEHPCIPMSNAPNTKK
jgi:hypothetical protein